VFLVRSDGSGHGQGQWYLGSATPDSAGSWTLSTDRLAPGDVVTATATDAAGNTSEFGPDAVVPGSPSLWADVRFFPSRLGGVSNFTLDAGAAYAGRVYVLGGSISGTTPGIPLGTITVPLNYDPFTATMLTMLNTPVFANFFGVLDGSGQATAQLDLTGIPNPGWNGLIMHFAFVTLSFDYASNPVAIEVTAW
jgi:hypothetical protein